MLKASRLSVTALCAFGFLAACGQVDPAPKDITPDNATKADQRGACATAEMIGRFDPSTDLFIGNFDIKTDVDDLHSIAALATVLKSPGFACVDHFAVHGAYGVQGGDFIPAPELMAMAFVADDWADAHADRAGAVAKVASRARAALARGGDVWVMEAGQSDVSAAIVTALADTGADLRARFHIVQHSDWNENVTDPAALAYVKENADYTKIPDGNGLDNGSPGFNTPDGAAWEVLLTDENVGPIWSEAKRLADIENADGKDYFNPSVGEGGLDFSDTAEAMYIFGLEDMRGVEEFVERFVGGE